MSVLDKLRISTGIDDEYDQESETEFDTESGTEPEEEFNPNHDPQPGQTAPRAAPRARSKLAQVREASPRITKKMREDAQGEIESIVTVIALGWGWQAPPCGEALEEAAPEFAEKLTKILARNPRWLQRVRDGGLIANVIQLFGTLAPVARVAYAHYSQPKEDSTHGVVFDPSQYPPYDGTGFSRAS